MTVKFMRDEEYPGAIRDTEKKISISKNYRDTPHGTVNLVVRWKGANQVTVNAKENMDEKQRIFEITIESEYLLRSILEEEKPDLVRESSEFILLFRESLSELYRRYLGKMVEKSCISVRVVII